MLALRTATIVDGTGLTRIHAKAENVAMTTPTTAMILSTAFIQLVSTCILKHTVNEISAKKKRL